MSSRSEPAGPLLVADVGAATCTAALVDDDYARLLAEPATGAPAWPAAVYRTGGRMLTGTYAEHQRQVDPAGYASGLLRALGAADDDRPPGFRPVEQVAALLAALRQEAGRAAGAPVDRALLTVPGAWAPGDPRRARLLAAAEAAGFGTAELLPAPVAAGHAPVVGPGMADGDLVLVYDLGGGCFDAALVRLGPGAPELLGHAGVDDAGAEDVDAALAGRIAGAYGPAWAGAGPDTAARLDASAAALARRVRHALSDAPAVEDYLLPDAAPFRLDRRELAALAAPVLDRTVACCRRLLAGARVPAHRVATVLLTGGAARMPAVVDRLAAEFGRPLRRVDDPELTVVRGAVRWREHGPPRTVPADTADDTAPLAFTLPGGAARLLRWLVAPGDGYAVGDPLGRVRLPGGALWDLTASAAGTLDRHLVDPGAEVVSGQWLAVARS